VSGYRPVKVDVGSLGFAVVVFLGGGIAQALLLYDVEPARVLILAAVCTLVPPATIVLPWWWARAVVILVAEVAVASWVTSGNRYSGGYAWCWFATTACGLVLLGALVYRRWWRRRLASAEGAPPSGLDPSREGEVPFLARWKDAAYEYETTERDLDLVLGAVRSLNGKDHSYVSVYIGRGRLDVGGDAQGLMIVQQSDDRRNWHQVLDPTHPEKPRDAQRIVYAGALLGYPRRDLVRLHDAEAAVTAWMTLGQRATSLTWWDDSGLAPVTRPRYLQNAD
jgi:hypothetical protein